MKCECLHHRYHVVHTIDGSDQVFDHSQGTWDSVFRRGGDGEGIDPRDVRSFPSDLYEHGMTAQQLIAKADNHRKQRSCKCGKPAMDSYATCRSCHEDSLTQAERFCGVQ